MAHDVVILDRSRIAGQDLSSPTAAPGQYSGVILNNTGQVVQPSAGNAIYGVVQNKPTSGKSAEVRVAGVTRMRVGASTVTAGDKVMVDANGAAVTATSTNFAIGWAEDTATTGNIVSVLLMPGGKL